MKPGGFLKRYKPLRSRRFNGGPDVAREPKPAAKPSVQSLHRGTYAGTTSGVAVEKEHTIQCEAYRKLVAALPCIHCGIHGYSQAAHPNTDKAGGKKLIDDRLCFPLCTVHPVGADFVRGCHERFDQGALFTKEARRELEPAWGAQTRAVIKAAGLWPAPLPMWDENNLTKEGNAT